MSRKLFIFRQLYTFIQNNMIQFCIKKHKVVVQKNCAICNVSFLKNNIYIQHNMSFRQESIYLK